MIIVNLLGGLGNQMFQYAFGKSLSIKYQLPLFLNIEMYKSGESNRNFDLDIFKLDDAALIDKNEIAKLFIGKTMYHVKENDFKFDKKLLNQIDNVPKNVNSIIAISGYWQSEKYFASVKDLIRKDFDLNFALNKISYELLLKITSVNSVMINVRRGDFLKKLNYHGVVSKEYIYKAVKIIEDNVSTPYFFVFSDDLEWCKNNLSDIKNLTFIDEKFYGPKYKYYLKLMAACKHQIISNSTFSWWAAWLNNYQHKIVIAPLKWFAMSDINTQDLLPALWLRI